MIAQISFTCDAEVKAHVRINCCVTQKLDSNCIPIMMYTPDKKNYISEMRLIQGKQ